MSVEAFRGGTDLQCPGSDQSSWINWSLDRLKDTCRHAVGTEAGTPTGFLGGSGRSGCFKLDDDRRPPSSGPSLLPLEFVFFTCRLETTAYSPTLPSRDAPT